MAVEQERGIQVEALKGEALAMVEGWREKSEALAASRPDADGEEQETGFNLPTEVTGGERLGHSLGSLVMRGIENSAKRGELERLQGYDRLLKALNNSEQPDPVILRELEEMVSLEGTDHI